MSYPPMGYPGPRVAWATTALLTTAYILSYVDRSILGLLIQPIKADLNVSDEQVGYLIGWAFGLFYAGIGLPLGWLADRRARTRIVAVGVALWSGATIASGLAHGFAGLFVARMGVGIGEAVLSPCAMSLIADSFAPDRRGRPVGTYSAALSVGAGLASLIGAAVLGMGGAGTVTMPLFGTVRSWQFALIVVGLPGLVLAPLFLVLAEPARHRIADAAAGTIGDTWRHLGMQRWPIGGITALVAVMTTIAYSQQFNAAAFTRSFGWAAKDYARANGLINLVVGPATVVLVGVVVDRLRARGMRDAALRILVAGFVPMLPLSAMALFMPSAGLALAVLGLASVTIAAVTASGIMALLDIVPGTIRGQVVALYYMAISIAGLGLGPTTVGVLSTRVFGEAQLRLAIAAIPIVYGIVPLLLLPIIAARYRARLQELP